MTQEEKQLLLKDLCARLPYGIMCRIDHDPEGEYDIGIDDERFIDDRIVSVCHENEQIFVYEDEDYPYSPEEIRPYLRPMSSMTKDEKREFQNILSNNKHGVWLENSDVYDEKWEISVDSYYPYIPLEGFTNGFDWLNAHHFDYRGLIERGLAMEAPEGMYEIN